MSKGNRLRNPQLQKILQRLADHEDRIRLLESGTRPAKKSPGTRQADADSLGGVISSIVNRIGDCDESEEIQRRVLDQRSVEARILLCFFIPYKYFDKVWLASGDIEKITSELGIKIDTRNVTNKIKKLRQYLESRSTRRRGRPTPYRLNRKGFNHFQKILQSQQS